MSTTVTTGKGAESTDFLARKEGCFERCSLTGFAVAIDFPKYKDAMFSPEKVDQSAFDAKRFFAQFETFDGEKSFTASIAPAFLMYDERLETLQKILQNRYAWVVNAEDEDSIHREDWSLIIAPEREDAKWVLDNKNALGQMTLKNVTTNAVKWITTLGRSSPRRDRPSRVVTAYSDEHDVNEFHDIPAFFDAAPTRTTEAQVLEVPSPNRLKILCNNETFTTQFSGRPGDGDHVPTRLAEQMGVGIPENLEDEEIVIAPGVHNVLLTRDFAGKNESGTLHFGV